MGIGPDPASRPAMHAVDLNVKTPQIQQQIDDAIAAGHVTPEALAREVGMTLGVAKDELAERGIKG